MHFSTTTSLLCSWQLNRKPPGPKVHGRTAMSPSLLDHISLGGFSYSEVVWVGCITGNGISELYCITTTRTICWSLPGARSWSRRAFVHAQAAGLGVLRCSVGFLNVLVFMTPQCLSRNLLFECTLTSYLC